MNRLEFIQTTAAGIAGISIPNLFLSCKPGGLGQNSKRPNIVLIMADDMGYSDIGCYGSEIATPNLDRLSSGGLRFTQFYNCARCCPTRASLLTGLYPHQTGIGHMTRDYGYEAYTGDLSQQCVTIAEVLRSAGYRTMISGKWHLTKHTGIWDGSEYASKHNWPLQRGFEKFYGFIHGSSSYFDPILVRDNEPVEVEDDNFYLTDAISDNAVKYLDEYSQDNVPFFLYVSYNAPHWPMHALPEDIERYKDRYHSGWDALREERYRRMIEMGLVKEKWGLTPRDSEAPAWENAEHKEWQVRRMAVYAAMIDRMDQGIGRIMQKVREMGHEENTLILFLADNGGCPETVQNPRKFYVPRMTRDGRPVHRGTTPEIMPGPADTFQGYGLPWSNASNTPFRLFKRWVHEGGIATPLIAYWPSVIMDRGAITHQAGHVMDVMATCLDLAGAKHPKTYNGHDITPLEGKSLLPIFQGNTRESHEFICWEHEGNRAIRQGRWKLVSYYNESHQFKVGKGERAGKWDLYDLEADRTEMHNLVGKHPEKAAELQKLFEKWSKKVGVVPWETLEAINTRLQKKEQAF